MATRLYTVSGTPSVSPSPAAVWDATAAAFERLLLDTVASGFVQAGGLSPGSGVANDDTVRFQGIYGPLAAGAISGTVQGQVACREANGATDARTQILIRVLDPPATGLRGTLLALDTAALSSEFVVSSSGAGQSRMSPRGGAVALASVTAQAGDWLVVEWGFRNHGTNTNNVFVRSGSAGATADLAAGDETTNADAGPVYRGWIEFSQTLALYVPAQGRSHGYVIT